MAGTTTTSRLSGVSGGFPTPVDETSKIRQVDDLFEILSPYEVPFLTLVGGPNSFEFGQNKVEWQENDLWKQRLTLSSTTGFTDTSQATLYLNADEAYMLHQGHVLLVDSEQMWVTGVTAAATVTVTRDYAGTTAATHATAATVYVMGIAVSENQDAYYAGTPIYAWKYNNAQHIEKAYHVSLQQQNTNSYGSNRPDLDQRMMEGMREAFVALEHTMIRGQRADGASANEPVSMGGIQFFYTAANGTTVTDRSDAALRESDINATMQTIYETVADSKIPNTILCGPWGKRKITSFFENRIRSEVDDRVGGATFNFIETDFGRMRVVLLKTCPPEQVWLINPEHIKVGHWQNLGLAEYGLAQSGPYVRRMLYGSYSAEFKYAQAAGLIDNISLTA